MNTEIKNVSKARKLALGAVIGNVALLLGAALALPEPARTILPVAALILPLISATVVEAAAGLTEGTASA
jgi:hypothetical protein